MKVVIATSNQGKLKEFETLLAPLNWQFYSLQDLGINSPVEDGATFYENALIKAKHAASISGFPAIADDSGLCVDSLNGAPGIKSARYAGENSSDANNNLKLLESLENETQRNAAFVACWLKCACSCMLLSDDSHSILLDFLKSQPLTHLDLGVLGFKTSSGKVLLQRTAHRHPRNVTTSQMY